MDWDRVTKNEVMGRAVVGVGAKNSSGRNHWDQVRVAQSPVLMYLLTTYVRTYVRCCVRTYIPVYLRSKYYIVCVACFVTLVVMTFLVIFRLLQVRRNPRRQIAEWHRLRP